MTKSHHKDTVAGAITGAGTDTGAGGGAGTDTGTGKWVFAVWVVSG